MFLKCKNTRTLRGSNLNAKVGSSMDSNGVGWWHWHLDCILIIPAAHHGNFPFWFTMRKVGLTLEFTIHGSSRIPKAVVMSISQDSQAETNWVFHSTAEYYSKCHHNFTQYLLSIWSLTSHKFNGFVKLSKPKI
jgi:hypothetical protein